MCSRISMTAAMRRHPRRLHLSAAGLLVLGCAVGREPSEGSETATAMTTSDSTGPATGSATSSNPTTADSLTSGLTTGEDSTGTASEASTTGLVTTSDASTTGDVMTTEMATGTTGPAVLCGDARVSGDEECDDGNKINDDDCSNSCQSPRLVFVTSTVYKGDLAPQLADKTGLDLADAHCQQQAELGGKVGHFRAWLSDSTGSPATRFDTTFGGAYKLVTGDVVAATGWVDLTDGTLAHAIDRDQNGTSFPGDAVRTNTQPNGTAFLPGESCNDWTSTSTRLKSFVGFTSAVDDKWTANEPNLCSVVDRLYCFEDVP